MIRPIIEQAHEMIAQPGQLVLEFAASQKQAVLDLAKENAKLADPDVLSDHERLPRVLVADRTAD